MKDPTELVIVGGILGLFGAMLGWAWYAVRARARKLARLPHARIVVDESVSGARILAVLALGALLAAASAPLMMTLFPKSPMMFLVCIALAFTAVLAPLTFARRLTVVCRLVLDERQLRLEPRGERAVSIDLAQPFALDAQSLDDEMLVRAEQGRSRIHFSYRRGPAVVTLPLGEPPDGWFSEGEQATLFGDEARIIHERLRAMPELARERT
jgi:hypothetical protein